MAKAFHLYPNFKIRISIKHPSRSDTSYQAYSTTIILTSIYKRRTQDSWKRLLRTPNTTKKIHPKIYIPYISRIFQNANLKIENKSYHQTIYIWALLASGLRTRTIISLYIYGLLPQDSKQVSINSLQHLVVSCPYHFFDFIGQLGAIATIIYHYLRLIDWLFHYAVCWLLGLIYGTLLFANIYLVYMFH